MKKKKMKQHRTLEGEKGRSKKRKLERKGKEKLRRKKKFHLNLHFPKSQI